MFQCKYNFVISQHLIILFFQSIHTIMMKLEDFSNEIFYEIFDYLGFTHIFQAFYYLNRRFQSLVIHSNNAINVTLSLTSKTAFEDLFSNKIIRSHIDRIQSLRIEHPFSIEILSFLPSWKEFTQLKCLHLEYIEANQIHSIVNHLWHLPALTSLTLQSVDIFRKKIAICNSIFH